MFSWENVVSPNTSGMKLVWQPDDRKVIFAMIWLISLISQNQRCVLEAQVSGLKTDLQPVKSSVSRTGDVNESLHQRPLKALTLIQINNYLRFREVKPSKTSWKRKDEKKQNKTRKMLWYFSSFPASALITQPDRPEVSRPPRLSARTHSQLRLDRAFSVHRLIQANCAGDNRRRKKSEPGRAEILEPACTSHCMTGALGMRPQQGSAVSSDNWSGYQ